MSIPKAKKVAHQHRIHNHVRQDDYYWLNNKENPDVIAYLEDENRYFDETLQPLQPQINQLFQEMVERIPDQEVHVPVQKGPYYYYARMTKEQQYPIYARKQAANREQLDHTPEEVVLDLNTMVEGDEFLSVTVMTYSPDQSLCAYLENRDGTDRYTLLVKDLSSGEMLSDRVEDVFLYGSLAWDATGEYLFYVKVDHSQRPYQLWRHKLGSLSEQDVLLYEESDSTFGLHIAKSQSGAFLFVESESKISTEVRYLDTTNPLQALQLFDARRKGIEYHLEHWNGQFLVRTNEDAKNFRIQTCPVDATSQRTDLFPYDESMYIEGMEPFSSALFIEGRTNGLSQVWVYQDNRLKQLDWDEPIYSVSLGNNLNYETNEVLLTYESQLTPRTTYAYQTANGDLVTLHVQEVPGQFDKANYVQERLWASAEDGVEIPMFAVYQKDALANGPAPLILNAYGSYGINSDPHFSPISLPLLDRGVVLVTAQIRGGSEMGYSWYEDGKFLNKKNTFTDYIASAKHLIRTRYTTSAQLAATGASAGGLLMGAVANMAGDLFAAMAAGVPFVDVVTTILDESLPLTTLEWDEWGNPNDKTYYDYMLSYSPYDNVEAKSYPHLIVTTGLNDPRVGYWEPAKWVAKLRDVKTDTHQLVLRTHMGAGHGGSSGRFNRYKERAAELVFLLDKIGVTVSAK